MSDTGDGENPPNSWLAKSWRATRSLFGYGIPHERLPSEDGDIAPTNSPQAGPSTPTPRVPPSSPVSPHPVSTQASGYVSDSSNHSETTALVNRANSVGGSSRGAGLPRVSSFQRALQAISALGRSSTRGSSEEPEGAVEKSSRSSGSLGRVGMNRVQSGLPTCLICLEPLTPDDFESGEAMSLACECKGDMSLRHRACALKWVNVKGDLICDICRSPINNLPAPPPRSDNGEEGLEEGASGRFPGATDVFDCIRMTWVITIVCILFFEFNITKALFTGMVVAVLYTFSCQIMRCLYTRPDDPVPPHVGPGMNTINVAPVAV
ncbi:hypothetical protein BSKO_05999 [Bryopsis sp. KO-2023]|nr:hypothetical protein BSKO_05999 [Bryopsis sp. KO-2023]